MQSNADWDSVTVLRKKQTGGSGVLKSQTAVNSAMRSGTLTSEKKHVAANAKTGYDAAKAAKVDRETEDFHIERVSMSVAKAIQKGRQEKNLTQKDLATKINEKPTIVNEFEAGKAVPNQQVLIKMERVLGIKLRGKNIGEKIEPKSSQK